MFTCNPRILCMCLLVSFYFTLIYINSGCCTLIYSLDGSFEHLFKNQVFFPLICLFMSFFIFCWMVSDFTNLYKLFVVSFCISNWEQKYLYPLCHLYFDLPYRLFGFCEVKYINFSSEASEIWVIVASSLEVHKSL